MTQGAVAGNEARERSIVIETKYGQDSVRVTSIAPTQRLLVVAEPCIIPKGRVLRAQRAKRAVMLKTDAVIGEGEVLYPRWYGGTLGHDHYEGGLYDAIRGRAQTMLGYGARDVGVGEPQTLRLMQSSIRNLCALLADYAHLDTAERNNLCNLLGATANRLVWARNSEKVVTYNQLTRASSVRDSLGRSNPGMARARLVSSVDYLDLRIGEIRRITPRVGYYEFALIAELDRIMSILREADHVLRLWVGERGLLYGDPRRLEQSTTGMNVRLNSLAELVATISVEPFLTARNQLTREFARTSQFLRARNVAEAVDALHQALERVTLEFVRNQLETLRTEVSCAIAARKTGQSASLIEQHMEQFVRNVSVLIRHRDLRPEFRLPGSAETAIGDVLSAVRQNEWQEVKRLLSEAADQLSL